MENKNEFLSKMIFRNDFTDMTNAGMFLVSNFEMICAAIDKNIVGVFPTLNFRRENELSNLIDKLNDYKSDISSKVCFGVNLIVQQSNPLYKKHLSVCIDKQVKFFITSLGNPLDVITAAHQYGGKVFCDVTNLKHASKAAISGCDGFIAVGQGAGGHAGPFPLSILIPALKKEFPNIAVVAAGGIGNGSSILAALTLGASAVSIGTRFIASNESPVSDAYKEAIVQMGMEDIVLTERVSGTPLSIMNTDYARKIGLKQNFVERYFNQHPKTKKWFKMFIQMKGLKKLEHAVLPGSYKTLWSAGQSVELVDSIKPSRQIIDDLISETKFAFKDLNSHFM